MKRIITVLLSVCMVVCMMPSVALAEGTANNNTLPDGLIRLDYLESTGGQVIDTGVPLMKDITVEAEVAYLGESTDGQTMGWSASDDKGSLAWGHNSGKFLVVAGGCDPAFYEASSFDHNKHVFYIKDGLQKIDNVTFGDLHLKDTDFIGSASTNSNLFLFARHVGWEKGSTIIRDENEEKQAVSQFSKAKLYSCKIWENGELIREFIPFGDLSSGKSGLYDVVNKKEYYNRTINDFPAYDKAGSCGENVNWSFDSATGVLTITGTGAMNDFEEGKSPWQAFINYVTTMTVSEGVTSIGAFACKNFAKLKEVNLPSTIESIGERAFFGCDLTSIRLPSGLSKIGPSVFAKNPNLGSIVIPETNHNFKMQGNALLSYDGKTIYCYLNQDTRIEIPETVETIYEGALRECTKATEVVVPKSVSHIGQKAFSTCSNLHKIYFYVNDELTIDLYAFDNCNSELEWHIDDISKWCAVKVPLEDSHKALRGAENKNLYDIEDNQITELVVPEGIAKINPYTFMYMKNIKKVILPESVHEVSKGAFFGCMELETFIAKGSTKMNSMSLGYCPEIKEVVLPGDSTIDHAFGCDNGINFVNGKNIDPTAEQCACNPIIYINEVQSSPGGNKSSKIKFRWAILNGGAVDESTVFEPNKLANPVKVVWNFDGWYAKNGIADGDWGAKTEDLPADDQAYYAKWVLGTPTVTLKADKTSVVSGGDVTLTAEVPSSDGVRYEYQWYKGSTEEKDKIEGATNNNYTASGLTNDTTYYCKVTAAADGGISKAVTSEGITISIAAPGNVTITNNKTTATLGEKPFTFTYNASGDVTVASSDTSVATVEKGENNSVKVTVVGEGETVIYVEFAGNDDFTAASDSFTLTVKKAPPSSYPTAPSTPTDNVTNSGATGTDSATTTADINTTASNGTTDAVVDQTTAKKIVDKAASNQSAEVIIDATTSAGTAEKTTVTLPTDTVKKIVEKTDAEVTIKTDAAEVKLDQKTVEAVASKAAGSDVKIVVEKTKDETKEMDFELKVVSGGVVIGEFDGGNVKVTVKLNASLAALKNEALVCVYIDDDGIYSKVDGKKNNDGTYTFTTGHFSSYAIMAEEEADAIIAEQTLEALKNTKLVARTEMSKAKGKRAVKVYWYAKDGSKLNFDGYEVYRSLKRYKGFGTKPFFETTKTKYYNTAVKKGTRYYYKVRGYKMINGEKAYTEYSTKAWRTVK